MKRFTLFICFLASFIGISIALAGMSSQSAAVAASEDDAFVCLDRFADGYGLKPDTACK